MNLSSLKYAILFFCIFVLFNTVSFSQQNYKNSYSYISPLPNSKYISTKTNIIIRPWEKLNSTGPLDPNLIRVAGDKSGIHNGELLISDDNETIVFNPNSPFINGENVNVVFNPGRSITTLDNKLLDKCSFSFKITNTRLTSEQKQKVNNILLKEEIKHNGRDSQRRTLNGKTIQSEDLPPDFPFMDVTTYNNPSPGEIFSAPFNWPNTYGYLVISDNYGVPIFYKRAGHAFYGFTKQMNGYLTYFEVVRQKYYEVDSSYTKIDSFQCRNGYNTDLHELIILPNGHTLLIGTNPQYVRMDTIVQGGDSSAIVVGEIIQELDHNKNVVFQWRSWDHYKITDATNDIDLTDSIIDYVHANAIEEDSDGNILFSCRHLDEVTKINRQTGEIIWRLGGSYCKNNQFQFVNDLTGFSHQHDIRRLPNGNITLFDNGNLHNPPYSRAVEYQLDEVNKIATSVWEYKNNPETYSFAMGKTQRLSNHNTLIGWGFNVNPPAISEVKPDGNVALAIAFDDTVTNYRAFKFPWKTNLFSVNPDSLNFINVNSGDSDIVSLNVKNNSDSLITLNSYYSTDSSYTILGSFPISILPDSVAVLNIKFKPTKEGIFEGNVHLRLKRDNEMISQYVHVYGITDTTLLSVKNKPNIVKSFKLFQNYPNPFNPTTTITFTIPSNGKVKLNVYDILGREVAKLVDGETVAGKHSVVFNASNLSSGVYFYRIDFVGEKFNSNNKFTNVKKLLLIK